MKLAIFSDIHSNDVAFKVCIDYIKKQDIDGIIFLGDNVSDCPNPQATLHQIKQLDREYKTWHIKGNREEYLIKHADGAEDGWNYSSYKGSLLYTYEHLSKEDIDTFRMYPNTRVISIPRMAPITIAHGSPTSSRELLHKDKENTKYHLDTIETDYLLCGHTHAQFTYEYNGKILINPGSIGVAIGGYAVAHLAILEWKDIRWDYKLIQLPYNMEELKKKFEKSSLMEKAYIWPKCILKSIELGINMGPLCAKRAYDMAVEDGMSPSSNIVEETYWRRAAKELNIISE